MLVSERLSMEGVMFGFLKGKKSDKELMIEDFQKVITLYNSQDEKGRFEIDHGLAFCWKIFVSKYGSAENFKGKTRNEKRSYLIKLTEFEGKCLNEGRAGIAFGASLLKMYLATIIEGDLDLEDMIARTLDPIIQRGWPLVV